MWGVSSNGVLPENDGEENYRFDYKTVELSYKFDIKDNFWIEPKVGYFKYDYWFDYTQMGHTFPLVMSADQGYDKKYAKLDSSYIYANHNLLAGVEISKTSEERYGGSMTYTMYGQTVTEALEKDEFYDRDLIALYVHDNISFNDSLMLSLGARFDKYDDSKNDDIDSHLSPRLALVYDIDKINILKLQYAESFRIPTFHEQTNDNVTAETNKMVEVQYILKKEINSLRTTLFYSVIDSLIYSTDSMRYANKIDDIQSYGIELEYSHNFNTNFLVLSNFSYVKAKYKDSGNELINYAPLLANVALSYTPYSSFSPSLKLRYVGSKKRDNLDTRDDFSDSTIVDLTFKSSAKSLNIVYGIKNIGDVTKKSPSPIKIATTGPSAGEVSQTYEDDYIMSGRNFYVGIDYKF